MQVAWHSANQHCHHHLVDRSTVVHIGALHGFTKTFGLQASAPCGDQTTSIVPPLGHTSRRRH
jgi:hypothetical protein